MKLIVSGATGYLATEVLRQSLARPEITSVVALSRRPVSAPEGLDASKLKNVILKDFNSYSEEDKKELSGANGCIWTIGITPAKAIGVSKEDLRRVHLDYTVAGIKAMHEASTAKPFRFIYLSGFAVSRDPKAKYTVGGDQLRLRGEVETTLAKYAAESNGEVEFAAARSGLITTTGASISKAVAGIVAALGVFKVITAGEISAALISQVVNGIEKDPLGNDDLVRIGRQVLAEWKKPSESAK